MSLTLSIKTENDVKHYYLNHTTFHEGDCGIDLFCPDTITVNPGETETIHFKISCEANSGYFLVPRSSISKTPLRMANSIGIIDKGYRGELMAKVDNIKKDAFTIEAGTRLFQIVSPVMLPINFKLVDQLSDTTRGSGGFGSTGK